ncbi:hypothetical protein SAMN05443633_103264 [Chryseobacterium arachidis]|uniref:Uncharacterized protein n=1 Tax=Chryseobacterium arachidis TaxID=1416778 RepID=A0A1M4ZTT2_9FLAO|nr:hypothetical protein SAMN05443633_103264 [Chryseobacterium arachidis]
MLSSIVYNELIVFVILICSSKGGIGYSQLRMFSLFIDGELSPFIKLFNPSITYLEVIKLKQNIGNNKALGLQT